MDKLVIKRRQAVAKDSVIAVGGKANALLDELVVKTGRSKRWITDKCIEWAFEHIVIEDENDDTDEE